VGIRELAEELESVDATSDGSSACAGCGSLGEILRQLALDAGLREEALLEASKCEPKCREKYTDKDGSFKGGPGDAFESCKKMFTECCKGVKDPEALCAYISRRSKG